MPIVYLNSEHIHTKLASKHMKLLMNKEIKFNKDKLYSNSQKRLNKEWTGE